MSIFFYGGLRGWAQLQLLFSILSSILSRKMRKSRRNWVMQKFTPLRSDSPSLKASRIFFSSFMGDRELWVKAYWKDHRVIYELNICLNIWLHYLSLMDFDALWSNKAQVLMCLLLSVSWGYKENSWACQI